MNPYPPVVPTHSPSLSIAPPTTIHRLVPAVTHPANTGFPISAVLAVAIVLVLVGCIVAALASTKLAKRGSK